MKVLVYGLGKMGTNHARAWSELGHDVYAYDERDISGDCREFGYEHVTDIDKGIAAVDAVSICVPNIYHLEAAKKVFKQQKHALIEKPIAKDLKDALLIIEHYNLNKKYGDNMVAMVGHVENFNPAYVKLKSLLRGEEIENMRFKRYGPMPPTDFSCGATLDLGIHDVDLATRLTDERISWVRGDFLDKIIVSGNEYETKSHVDIGFGYKSTVNNIASFDFSWVSEAKVRMADVTTKKRHYVANFVSQKLGQIKEFGGGYTDYIDLKRKSKNLEDIEVEPKEPLKEEILHFIGGTEGRWPIMVPLEDGYKGLKTITVAEESARQNGIKLLI